VEAHEVLGVPESAPLHMVRAAYIQRVSLVHPDRARDEEDRVRRTAATIDLNLAYAEMRRLRSPAPAPRKAEPRRPRSSPRRRPQVAQTTLPASGEVRSLALAMLLGIVAALIAAIVTGDGAISTGMWMLAVLCCQRKPQQAKAGPSPHGGGDCTHRRP
jgi:hypothetical protein